MPIQAKNETGNVVGTKTVYKYLSPDGGAAALRDGTIQFALAATLNDPFECKPAGFFPGDVNRLIEKAWASHKNEQEWIHFLRNDLSLKDIPPDFLEMRLAHPECIEDNIVAIAQRVLEKKMTDFQQLTYLSCFSTSCDSLLMWAHYAKDHSGIVIGYHDRASFFQTMVKVDYQSERAYIPFGPGHKWHPEWPGILMSRKSIEWAYEDEVRCILLRNKPSVIDSNMKPGLVQMERDQGIAPIFQRTPESKFYSDGRIVYCKNSNNRFPKRLLCGINPEDIAEIYLGIRTDSTLKEQCKQFSEEHSECKLFEFSPDPIHFKLIPHPVGATPPVAGRLTYG